MDKITAMKKFHNDTFNLGIEVVQEIAMKILKKNKIFDEFTMGMGTWCFWDKRGFQYSWNSDKTKEMQNFMSEWDDYLHLTGQPMKITSEGDVITDW